MYASASGSSQGFRAQCNFSYHSFTQHCTNLATQNLYKAPCKAWLKPHISKTTELSKWSYNGDGLFNKLYRSLARLHEILKTFSRLQNRTYVQNAASISDMALMSSILTSPPMSHGSYFWQPPDSRIISPRRHSHMYQTPARTLSMNPIAYGSLQKLETLIVVGPYYKDSHKQNPQLRRTA